jgi:hypothetical protein
MCVKQFFDYSCGDRSIDPLPFFCNYTPSEIHSPGHITRRNTPCSNVTTIYTRSDSICPSCILAARELQSQQEQTAPTAVMDD